jgi:hypothetical protein
MGEWKAVSIGRWFFRRSGWLNRTTAVHSAKLPDRDFGNRNRITGTGCANLDDLAGDYLTNRVVAINQSEQAQRTLKG